MPRNVAEFDPTNRFTDRVRRGYVRYRPRYPEGILTTLHAETGLTPQSIIADIGSGTGFSAERSCKTATWLWVLSRMPPGALLVSKSWQTIPASQALTAERKQQPCPAHAQIMSWPDKPSTGLITNAPAPNGRGTRAPRGWVALFWNSHRASLHPSRPPTEGRSCRALHLSMRGVSHERISNAEFTAVFDGSQVRQPHIPLQPIAGFRWPRGRTFSSSWAPRPDDTRGTARCSLLNFLPVSSRRAASSTITLPNSIFGRIARGADAPGAPCPVWKDAQ